MEQTSCAQCVLGNCDFGADNLPTKCTSHSLPKEMIDKSVAGYNEEENKKIFDAAAEVEYKYYCKLTRVEETVA